MFGRKKKTRDLDWQPEEDLNEAGKTVLSDTAAPSDDAWEADAASSPDTVSAAAHTAPQDRQPRQEQSDVWQGLIHPRSVLRFIGRNVVFVMVTGAIIFVLGLGIYFVLPAKYSTRALILVDPRVPRVTESESVISGIGADAAALTSYVEIMRSDGFLSNVVDELGVADDPVFAKAKNKTELISAFRKNLSAERQGATYIVQVGYKSGDPQMAAKYANGVAEAFVRDQRDYRTATSEEATQWLSERLKLLQTNLTQSEDAVAAYRARNGMVDAGSQGSLDDQQLASLVNQLATAGTEVAAAKARFDQARKDGAPASSDSSQSGQFTNLDQLLQEQDRLRRQLAELNQMLGARHPRVLANNEQQRIIAQQIEDERARLVQRSKQAYETALAKENMLKAQLADARMRAIDQNKAKVELASLEREAAANRNLYEQFLARFKITDEQSQLQFNEARIVSAAPVPNKSTKPGLSLVGPVLLILGGGLAVLFALVREAFRMPEMGMSGAQAQAPVRREEPHAHPVVPEADEHLVADETESTQDSLPDAQASSASIQESEHTPPFASDEELLHGVAPMEQDQYSAPLDGVQEDDETSSAFQSSDLMEELSGIEHHARRVPPASSEGEGEDHPELDDTIIPLNAAGADGLERSAVRAARSAAAKRVRQMQMDGGTGDPAYGHTVVMTLPDLHHVDEEETLLDRLVESNQDRIRAFVEASVGEEAACVLITAAQPGEAQDLTTDILREYAIDAGYHPVVISLQDQKHQPRQRMQATGAAARQSRVAKLESFEDFDFIPFVNTSGLQSSHGLAPVQVEELANLIALCKENYGFVVLETRQILGPDMLEDLMALVDVCLMVLETRTLDEEDLTDWKDWAYDAGVGLVINQTEF